MKKDIALLATRSILKSNVRQYATNHPRILCCKLFCIPFFLGLLCLESLPIMCLIRNKRLSHMASS